MDAQRVAFGRLFLEKVGRSARASISLRKHSRFKIGGPADLFFEAESLDEIRSALESARESGVRTRLIGDGTNILFDDAGFRGLIVKDNARGLSCDEAEGRLAAQAGTPLEDVTVFCRERGIAGLEFLAGIPGTVGGAVHGNAGAFGRAVGEILEMAHLLGPDGVERPASRYDLDFAYRSSRLKTSGDVILCASFRVAPGDRRTIGECMDAYLALRAERHPDRNAAYPGSYFKNPVAEDGTKTPAGRLLEQVGAKGMSIGGAVVFQGHANFILNRGGATARDVRTLAAELKRRVRERFGVDLEEEVIYVPAEP